MSMDKTADPVIYPLVLSELEPGSSLAAQEASHAPAWAFAHPGAKRRRSLFIRLAPYRLFFFTVVLPFMATIVYLFFIASHRYASEAQFIVRSANSTAAVNSPVLQVQGLSKAQDEMHIFNEYVVSRDVLKLIKATPDLVGVFAREDADVINRFPNFFTAPTDENFLDYFKKMATVSVDGATGIGHLRIVAFTPQDAQKLAQFLLQEGEGLLNRLNARAQQDAVGNADREIRAAREALAEAEAALTAYRNRVGMVDPWKESVAGLEQVGRLSTELAQARAVLAQMRKLTGSSPAIAAQSERVSSLQNEITRLKQNMIVGQASLTAALAEYERLNLDRDIAGRALASAESARQNARQEAERQQLYLQVIVAPNLADQHAYPKRLIWMAIILAVCLFTFAILRELKRMAIEHAQ